MLCRPTDKVLGFRYAAFLHLAFRLVLILESSITDEFIDTARLVARAPSYTPLDVRHLLQQSTLGISSPAPFLDTHAVKAAHGIQGSADKGSIAGDTGQGNRP